MKKTLTIAAAALISASVFAQTNVTSANIVGYSKRTINSNAIDIVALQFSGNGDGVRLADAFDGLTAYESKLYRYNGSGYDVFDYYGPYGWYQGATPVDDLVITNGTGLWLQGASVGTIALQSGEVPSADSITNTVLAGVDLCANPYPVATALSNLTGTALVAYDTKVYVYTGSGYAAYDYYGPYGWYQGATPSDDVEIAVGQGFWLTSSTGGTLIFSKNY